jgi:uncharacterized membrane protein (UPF0127 family)
MKFSFDAVFVNNSLEVVHIIEKMQLFRISPVVRKAKMVLELPAGTMPLTGTKIGDQLFLGKGDDVDQAVNIN